MRNLDFDPFGLPSKVMRAVGLVAISAAQTEHIMEQGIGGCIGIDIEYTAAITTHMTSPLRDHVLRAAAEIRIDSLDDLDELDKLLDEIRNSLPRRNNYLHNSLCVDKDTGELFASKIEARGRVDVELVPVTVDDIENDATRIYKAGLNLYLFLNKRGLLPPFPAGPRPRGHKSRSARRKRREITLKGQ